MLTFVCLFLSNHAWLVGFRFPWFFCVLLAFYFERLLSVFYWSSIMSDLLSVSYQPSVMTYLLIQELGLSTSFGHMITPMFAFVKQLIYFHMVNKTGNKKHMQSCTSRDLIIRPFPSLWRFLSINFRINICCLMIFTFMFYCHILYKYVYICIL